MYSVRSLVAVVAVLAALGAVMPASADAQGFTTVRPGGRGGTWDFYLPLTYAESATVEGQGGAKVDINSDWGFGFGFGYNINENFQVNGLFTWNSRSYEASRVSATTGNVQQYSNFMETSTFMINAVYYILNGPITPFVSGGIGITYVDTNIQNGPASGGCWYDPWWGYVCSSYVPTKTENDVSYAAGVGVRLDLNRQFSMQGSFNRAWIDISKASGTPNFDNWRLDLIFRM